MFSGEVREKGGQSSFEVDAGRRGAMVVEEDVVREDEFSEAGGRAGQAGAKERVRKRLFRIGAEKEELTGRATIE